MAVRSVTPPPAYSVTVTDSAEPQSVPMTTAANADPEPGYTRRWEAYKDTVTGHIWGVSPGSRNAGALAITIAKLRCVKTGYSVYTRVWFKLRTGRIASLPLVLLKFKNPESGAVEGEEFEVRDTSLALKAAVKVSGCSWKDLHGTFIVSHLGPPEEDFPN